VLWFNIAHYALRPWPWVLTALAAIVLYPGLAHPETSYMMIVNDHVPHALRGIILAGFLAAFMSTIATQLNWGTSYLVEDFYRRFLVRNSTEKHYVRVSQIVTVLLVIATGYVSAQLASIRSGWQVVLQIGAGTGTVTRERRRHRGLALEARSGTEEFSRFARGSGRGSRLHRARLGCRA